MVVVVLWLNRMNADVGLEYCRDDRNVMTRKGAKCDITWEASQDICEELSGVGEKDQKIRVNFYGMRPDYVLDTQLPEPTQFYVDNLTRYL